MRIGVTKLRLTGGEPLLRKRLPQLVARLAAIPGIDDLALTTNGSLLARQARALRDAGLRRLTISLDALDDDVFRSLSGGRGDVDDVLAGIDAAEAAGFPPIKFNCVVQRGINDDQVLPLVEHFRHSGHVLRFIEYMDVGTCNGWDRARVVPSAELRDAIHARWPLRALDAQLPRRSRAAPCVRRRRRRNRLHQFGHRAVLRRLPSRARVGRWQALHLPVRGRGHDLRAPLRRGEARARRIVSRIWPRGDRYSEVRGRMRDAAGASKCS